MNANRDLMNFMEDVDIIVLNYQIRLIVLYPGENNFIKHLNE